MERITSPDCKILTMTPPFITSYPNHANILSVISHDDETIPWLLNSYIQLEAPKMLTNGLRMDYYTSVLWKTCPWVYYQRMSRELILRKWDSIVDFIVDCIDLGYYVYFLIDTYYDDLRPAQILLEHKKIMLKRIGFMGDIQHLGHAERILGEYSEIARKMETVRNKFLKYFITKNKKILKEISQELDHIVCSEKETLERMVSFIHG